MERLKHGKSWWIQITILSFVLGMLISFTLKTQMQANREGMPTRMADAGALLRYAKEENIKLKNELKTQTDLNEKIIKEQASGITTTKNLIKLLSDTKMLAGTSSVEGPGVIITLIDSPNAAKADPTYPIDQLIVHYSDILFVVNELNNAGAEAISVNGHRIISNSSIRCAGTPILINNERVFPPYTIKAIGNSEDLNAGLSMPGSPANDLLTLSMMSIKKETLIKVPAYRGTSKYIYAKEIKDEI